MSEENVEIQRQAVEATLRRDRDAWLALHAEDFEAIPICDWPESDVRGREAAWDFMMKMIDAWEPVPIDDVKIVDAGGDKVLIHQRADFHGRGSGAEVEFEYWLVTTIKQDPARAMVRGPCRGPRSRRAVGVALWTRSAALHGKKGAIRSSRPTDPWAAASKWLVPAGSERLASEGRSPKQPHKVKERSHG